MMNSMGDYPIGAECDPSAPWRTVEPEIINVNVTVSETLSKSTSIKIQDYKEDTNVETEDGIKVQESSYDIDDLCLTDEYNSQKMSPSELIQLLKTYIERDIKNINKKLNIYKDNIDIQCMKAELSRLSALKKECEDWISDEFIVEKD